MRKIILAGLVALGLSACSREKPTIAHAICERFGRVIFDADIYSDYRARDDWFAFETANGNTVYVQYADKCEITK
jgi:hypothetical protein